MVLATKQPDLSTPVSILRRSTSAGGGASKKKKNNSPGAASFSQSAHTFDDEYDEPARRLSDDSFRGGDEINNKRRGRGDSLDSSNSNFTPITDPNELADRILNFQRSYASSLSSSAVDYCKNNDGKNPFTPKRGRQGQRHRPPPPPPRSTSLGRKRNKEMNSSANDIDHPKYCDEADEDFEYVRRMERIRLDQQDDSPHIQDDSPQFSASSSEYSSDTLRRAKMNDCAHPSPPPPPKLPFTAKKKNDELNRNLNESSVSANTNKFNSSSTTVTSSKETFAPRPVRISQFEDKWEAQQNQNSDIGTPPTKPKMTMASSLSTSSHVLKNLETSTSSQPVVSSTPQNCDKRGRCKYHPQYKLYKKKLLGGYEFISTCPMCDAKLEAKNNRSGSGENPSKGRNRSRSKERGGIRSTDQVPVESNLDKDDNFNASKASPGRTRPRRSKSADVEERRQRRPRTRRVDNRENGLNDSISSSNSFGKSFTNAFESIRDKLPNHPPPPSRQHRSRSREGRRLSDQSTDVGVGKSLENGLCAIDKGKRGRSRDKKSSSSSYDEIGKKKNLGNNPFVHEGSELNFDKKTGRCKKHPSVVLAKKSKFRSGSWEIIKQNGCPLCDKAGGGAPLRDEMGQDLDEDTKRRMDMLLRGHDTSGDTSPQWSKSVETRSGSATAPKKSIIDKIPAEGIRGNKVSRMLYTTPMGETGWYTGEIDLERNPHGQGRMRYKTGHSYEGRWIHGYGEAQLENLNRMKSGFGTNKAAWNQSEMAPSVRKAAPAPAPDSSKSMASRSAVHQHQYQQSSNQGYLSAQAQMQHVQQQQHYAQAQMQLQQQQAQMQHVWASMSPEERQMAMSQWYANAGMPSQPGYQMQGYPPM